MAKEYIERDLAAQAACEGADEWDGGTNLERDKRITYYVKAIPAADVWPVVHGKWKRIDYKPYGHDYVCSACNQMNDRASHYCPDCGAKMALGYSYASRIRKDQ